MSVCICRCDLILCLIYVTQIQQRFNCKSNPFKAAGKQLYCVTNNQLYLKCGHLSGITLLKDCGVCVYTLLKACVCVYPTDGLWCVCVLVQRCGMVCSCGPLSPPWSSIFLLPFCPLPHYANIRRPGSCPSPSSSWASWDQCVVVSSPVRP